MKQFIFKVEGNIYEDTEPFGDAWKRAKEKATELHCAVYRTVIDTEEQVFYNGGFFNDVKFATKDNVKIL